MSSRSHRARESRRLPKHRVLYHIGKRPAAPRPYRYDIAGQWVRRRAGETRKAARRRELQFKTPAPGEGVVFLTDNPIGVVTNHGIRGHVYAYAVPIRVLRALGGLQMQDGAKELMVPARLWDEVIFLGRTMHRQRLLAEAKRTWLQSLWMCGNRGDHRFAGPHVTWWESPALRRNQAVRALLEFREWTLAQPPLPEHARDLLNRVLIDSLSHTAYCLAHDEAHQPVPLLDETTYAPYLRDLFATAREIYGDLVTFGAAPIPLRYDGAPLEGRALEWAMEGLIREHVGCIRRRLSAVPSPSPQEGASKTRSRSSKRRRSNKR